MRPETANILSFLDQYTLPMPEDAAMKIANDFRQRRIEKGLTRQEVARQAGVPMSNVARFEQKGLISLNNLIALATAIDHLAELKNIFAEAKYSTVDELMRIRANTGKKKACPKSKTK